MPSRPPSTARTRRRLALLLASAALALAAGELVCRWLLSDRLGYTVDERNLAYRHHPRLGWFPEPGSERTFRGSREITVRHNADGLRDRERGGKRGPRLACYGDSFTWGYDVERDERFTERLQASLPGAEVLNLGVSGYGTDQAWLLMQETFARLQPDVVLLVFTYTDVADNAASVRYDGFHKPWFETVDGRLELRGVPVPRAENYWFARSALLRSSYLARAIARLALRLAGPAAVHAESPHERSFALLAAMRADVEARGAEFVVGREAPDPRVARFLDDAGFRQVDLTGIERYDGHGGHWTPAGHAEVAARLHRALSGWGLPGSASR